jgi:hypothetical protein
MDIGNLVIATNGERGMNGFDGYSHVGHAAPEYNGTNDLSAYEKYSMIFRNGWRERNYPDSGSRCLDHTS